MNWKLICQLSLFGLAMAFATIKWIPSKGEPVFWLIIFIICAILIAKRCSGKYFLHGFLTSLANCIWITTVHAIFYSTYLSNHKDMVWMSDMPIKEHQQLNIIIMGPLFGIASGLVLGLFAYLAGSGKK